MPKDASVDAGGSAAADAGAGAGAGPPQYAQYADIEQQEQAKLRAATEAAVEAGTKLRTLLTEVGGSSSVVDDIKADPTKFLEDSPPKQQELAACVFKVKQVEREIAAAKAAREEAHKRGERSKERQGDEAKMMAQMLQDQGDQVSLNVGGEAMTTTKRTLTAAPEGTLLEVVFSERHGRLGASGPIVIDRNPKHFCYVLDYLRAVANGQPPTPLRNVPSSVLDGVHAEAKYFGIDALAELANPPAPKPETSITRNQFLMMRVAANPATNFRGMNLAGFDFTGMDLRDCDFSFADLTGCTFSHALLQGATFANTKGGVFRGFDFSKEGDLSGSDFSSYDLTGCNFAGANLSSARFENANLTDCDFKGATVGSAKFKRATIAGADFTGCTPLHTNARYSFRGNLSCDGAEEIEYTHSNGSKGTTWYSLKAQNY